MIGDTLTLEWLIYAAVARLKLIFQCLYIYDTTNCLHHFYSNFYIYITIIEGENRATMLRIGRAAVTH